LPILDISVVLPPAQALAPEMASLLADGVGKSLGAAPGRVWVRLHRIASADYAENDAVLDDHALPVFVTILHARPPEGQARAREVAVLTDVVAAVLKRPHERVHVEYAGAGAGRIAFGGRLVD
jgi:phenylpyruvate tautomerase PptA (4-oxalocrotonate tautomerase family)